MGVYWRLLRYLTEIKREIAIKVFLCLVLSATYIGQAIVMAMAVTAVWAGGGFKDIVWLLAIALAAIVVRGVVSLALESYSKVMGAKIKGKLRLLVLDKIMDLGPGYLSAKRSGKISALALDGIESLEPFLVNYVPQVITVALSGLVVGAFLCRIDAVSGLIVIASMMLCVVVPYLTVPLINRHIVNYWSAYSVLTAQYVDAVQGITTLKTLNAAQEKGMELKKDATRFYEQSIRNTGISLLNSGLMLVLTSVVASVTVVVAALRADLGIMPVTGITAFLFLAAECARPMLELNQQWHASFLGLSVAKELFEFIDTEPDVKEKDHCDTGSLDRGLPSIELRGVSFSYREGAEALKNVSFSVSPGSTVAIVGRSGSGKTTVLNLLLRFYDPTSGEILLNGVDIRDYSLAYLRSKIAVVFQDSFLFTGTIADNIRMARPDASEEEIIAAAKAAHAHDFIMSTPDGYRTVVGERGMTLSGGERQRISIARAVLKDAPILILDEATSSVDAESERLIQSALNTLTKDRTTIIIAHRLSTIQHADRILVLDEGRLVEEGKHEDLLNRGGIYAALIAAQREATE
ncbi:MAG TPA: ABC transporter ATP-binding protein [Clostridia bacterium]|nr:ABC transporter ATP-binding protein [Clostridia bacterium]